MLEPVSEFVVKIQWRVLVIYKGFIRKKANPGWSNINYISFSKREKTKADHDYKQIES